MPIPNLISIELTPQEVTDINAAIDIIEAIINPKVVNLTPAERQRYGRLGDETENFVVKTLTYTEQKPDIIPFFIDTNELKLDVQSRNAVGPVLKRLSILTEKLEDTHKVIGWDLYNAIIAVYRNVKMLSKQDVPGTTIIYEDLKKQFPHYIPSSDEPVNPA